MQGSWNNEAIYYRCVFLTEYAARTKGSHPRSVYLREDKLTTRLDQWLARLFHPDTVLHTIDCLARAQDGGVSAALAEQARREIAACDAKLRQHRAALEAGADATIVAGWMTETQARRSEAESRLRLGAQRQPMTADQIASQIAQIGDIPAVLNDADPAHKAQLYGQLGLTMTYHPGAEMVRVSVRPLADMYVRACPRGERTHKPMRPDGCFRTWGRPVTGRTDRWVRRTTIGSVGMLALIAGTVSYLHMHLLVELHGQPGWVAALTPLSVDGMIVAASTTLLAESRSGGRGGLLPWALLAVGSVASLAANVAVAEPMPVGRVIAAWPSFALIASYELLMRQIRRAAEAGKSHQRSGEIRSRSAGESSACRPAAARPDAGKWPGIRGREAQVVAWQWALANRSGDGSLPSGRDIGREHGRHERWGRLVKRSGLAGQLDQQTRPAAM